MRVFYSGFLAERRELIYMSVLSEQKKTQVVTRFDYKILSPKKRSIVQQRTGEIKERLRRTAQDIWEVGQKLIEVRLQLQHGQFEGWLSAEFGWSRRTAYNFINVYEAFSESANFAQLDIATSALYKLAAPSTPKSIRQHFLDKAQQGDKITHKEISQALRETKSSNLADKAQPISLPSQKILQVIPKVRAGLEAAEVEKTVISHHSSHLRGIIRARELQSSSKQVMSLTQIDIKSGCWYLFDQINVLFCGDTASAEFCVRCPNATVALAITSDDWDHDWLIEKASNLIVLQESYLQTGLIEQTISLYSAEGDTVIFPWLPDKELLAIAHRLKRRIFAGDPSPERCQKAIMEVGLTVEQLTLCK